MITWTTRAILIFCLAASAAISAAPAQEVEQSLKQQFEGKVLVLRHSLQGNSQEYDSDGKVLKGGAEGPWTLYGRIKVDEVELSADNLLLKGHRVDYKFDPSVGQLVPFVNKVRMQVKVSLQQPPKKLAEADDVLSRVFAFTKKDVVDSAPEFWRAYLDAHIEPRPPEKKVEKVAPPAEAPDKHPELLVRDANTPGHDETRPFKIGRGVQAPQPLFTPAPAFPVKADNDNSQGIVVLNVTVDTAGKVQNIRLVRPVGMGMEEAAVAAVKTWRFKPANHEGEPVAVEINIEVAFNKY
jgi:TonB family protein